MDADRTGPRPRLPIPSWMDAWPRGVTPTGLSANARGVEFLYRAPGDRWFRVEASVQPLAPSGMQVRALPGADPTTSERLAKAVERQLVRTSSSTQSAPRSRGRVAMGEAKVESTASSAPAPWAMAAAAAMSRSTAL